MLCGSFKRKCKKTNDEYKLITSECRVVITPVKKSRKVHLRPPKIPATNVLRVLLDAVSNIV